MCGIAGYLDTSTAIEVAHKNLASSLEALRHRGPDSGAIWQDHPGISLGHRRLAVIDLDPRSDQPMHCPEGRYTIIYNGEIYNHRNLRNRLSEAGHSFQTESDTETLLHAYTHWGPDCLSKLDGMFAFAIWDAHEQRLFLARDRFGEKPLYYFCGPNGTFGFASELDGLRQLTKAAAELSHQGLRDYMEVGYTLTNSCILKNILKLPPAHFMFVSSDGEVDLHRYWDCTDLARMPKRQYRSIDEAAEEFRSIMGRSVRARLAADVPLGLFLSGGIDSSLILLAARDQVGPDRIDTFSAGFHEAGYSEVIEARQTANALSTAHHEVLFDPDKLLQDTPEILAATGEPFADSSLIPTYYLSAFTRQKVTVSLSGDAGDELFAGYDTYMADRLYRHLNWVPYPLFQMVDKLTSFLPASSGKVSTYYKMRAFCRGAATGNPEAAHWSWRRLFSDKQIAALLPPELMRMSEPSFNSLQPILDRMKDLSHLDRMQCLDLETWLADDILVKLDRMSMAHSLEGRAPFLSEDLVRFALTLPEEMRIRQGQKKALLRHIVQSRLGKETARRPKAGFNSPVSHWFKGPLKQAYLDLFEEPLVTRLIDKGSALRMLKDHEDRRDDHGFRLFAIFSLAHWLSRNADVTL